MKLHPSVYVVALATVGAHLAFCHRFGFYRDELYFIDCAKHLAWGYVDQPPLAPFVTWLTAPLGYPVWGLRFFPGALAGVTVLFGGLVARELGGRGFAQGLAALAIALAPGSVGVAYGLSTEFLSPAVWTALIYLTLRLVKTQRGSALHSHRPRRHAWDVRKIFDRRVCGSIGRRIARNRTR